MLDYPDIAYTGASHLALDMPFVPFCFIFKESAQRNDTQNKEGSSWSTTAFWQ